MKRALIPLLLIVTMVLAVTVASAQDFSSGTGSITQSNGWSTSGTWIGGSLTETQAAATHDLHTGASGAFNYDVKFHVGSDKNTLKIGLGAVNGNDYMVQVNGRSVTFQGSSLGTISGDLSDKDIWAKFSSTDGKVWTVYVNGVSGNFNINSVPDEARLDITKGSAATDTPIIYSVSFKSAEATPVPSEEPEASPEPPVTPTAAPPAGVYYDPEVVQDFYDNAYTKIYSPYDTITYNPDGSYNVTPGYPKAEGTSAAVPATYAVAGTVTAAASGKPVGGASVVLGDATQKTDDFGQFRFDGVSKGAYDIAVSAAGFASITQPLDVSENKQMSFALEPESAGGPAVASAANETGNMTVGTNTTATMPANNTTAPAPTQTKSPGFEAIVAALAIVAVAGLLLYANRKK